VCRELTTWVVERPTKRCCGGRQNLGFDLVPDRPPFAALLRELRRAAGLTQEELAARAGVGVRTLRDLEAARALRPQRSTVELLASALGLRSAERARFAAAARGRNAVSVHLRPVPPLIGRADDVAAVTTLLDVADLITLVGLSGVGRASVALTVAHEVTDRFPAGVGAVSVTEASTEEEVLGSAVTALGLGHVNEVPVRLAAEPGLLVVLGVDRNTTAATGALGWLRSHGPRLRVIATSRHPLGLPGEHEWAVPPLDVPPPSVTGAQVFAYPATVLFLDRLRRIRQRPVEVSEAATLAALVRRLGGLPLALELAAARGRVLSLDEMLARAGAPDPRAGMRQRGPADADPAGESVRQAVLASWRLLTPAEQACLCWLGVFEWRWSIELAEELLAAGPGRDIPDVVALVDRLAGLGLISVRPGAPENMRFWLLEAVRSVVLQEASANGSLGPARDRHAVVMARLAARTPAEVTGAAVATRLENLLSDLQAALDHLERRGSVPAQRDDSFGDDASADGFVEVARLRAEVRGWMERRGLTAPR
jgi:predicted ATPase/DNA-binding XRE family transcriptional regulator